MRNLIVTITVKNNVIKIYNDGNLYHAYLVYNGNEKHIDDYDFIDDAFACCYEASLNQYFK